MNSAVIAAISTAVFSRLNMRRLSSRCADRQRASDAAGARGVQSPACGRRGPGRPAPTGGAQPRRNAAAGRRRPPARCSSVSAQRSRSPQATTMPRRASTDDDLRRARRCPRPTRAAPALDRLAAGLAARAGKGIEGAQAALDRRRRLRASRSPPRPCRSCARRSRRRPAAASARQRRRRPRARSASTISRAAERGEPVVQARRWCRRRAIATRLGQQHVAGVEAGVHLHDGDAGARVAGLDRALDRRGAAPARQQRARGC